MTLFPRDGDFDSSSMAVAPGAHNYTRSFIDAMMYFIQQSKRSEEKSIAYARIAGAKPNNSALLKRT
jgi:hypothetical protein